MQISKPPQIFYINHGRCCLKLILVYEGFLVKVPRKYHLGFGIVFNILRPQQSTPHSNTLNLFLEIQQIKRIKKNVFFSENPLMKPSTF